MAIDDLTTPAQQEISPMTMAEAGDAIAASIPANLLGLGEEDEIPGDPSEEEAAEDVEADAAEADEASDDTEAEAEAEDEGEETDPETLEAQEEDPWVEVTLPGGKAETVPLSELVKGYSREQDYTQKTQAVSADKQSLDQERQQLQELQAHYINQLQATVQAPALQAPTIELLDEDPMEYQRQFALYTHAKDERETQAQELQVETQRQQEVGRRQQVAMLEQENVALAKEWPEFVDPEKGTKAQTAMRSGLTTEYGFTSTELDSLSDHRLVLLARDALRWRTQAAATPKVKARLKAKPTPLKPGAAQSTRSKASNAQSKRLETAKKTGNWRDMANALEDIL